VCNIPNQPYTKSNVNSKQHALVSIKLKLVYKTTVYRLVNEHQVRENYFFISETAQQLHQCKNAGEGQRPCGPCRPPAKWAASSNVERRSGTEKRTQGPDVGIEGSTRGRLFSGAPEFLVMPLLINGLPN